MAPPLAVTMGEPAGIGGEITMKAWLQRHPTDPVFYVIDDPDRLASLAAQLGWDVPIRPIAAPAEAAAIFAEALPVAPLEVAPRGRPGHPDPADTPAVIGAIDVAVDDVRSGRAAAIVTNPVHKESLYRGGFRYPGHTEYLAELAGGGMTPVMMLVCPQLRVVPVTIHLSLRRAIETLTSAAIVAAGGITAAALRRDFGIAAPILAVAGLNPHAGEGGALGGEEIDIVAPAIAELRRLGIDARGPLAADTMFNGEARRSYDAALCMYHDQALIPIKAIDFDGGVNVTLGLPFVRTSPDHGTAFAIAGKGVAREGSLVAALRLAAAMAAKRRTAGLKRSHPSVGPAAVAQPPLREVIARHGIAAQRRLGQNFLLDLNLAAKIARAAGPLDAVTVVEIGAGPGGLTRALLEEGAHRVVAVERDPRCLGALAELAVAYPHRLEVVAGDALSLDPTALAPAPRKIAANLPYNIATTLLLRWLGRIHEFAGLTLMFQREVALRLVAEPGSRSYGRLSVMTQWLARPRILFDVPARAFTPPPKVISSLVQIIPRAIPSAAAAKPALERVTAAAFGQRRKMLRSSLAGLGMLPEALLAKAGVPPTARAEDLSIDQFCAIARALEGQAEMTHGVPLPEPGVG